MLHSISMSNKAKEAAGALEQAADLSEAIQKAKAQLELMIDLNPQSMVLVDEAGSVVRANRAFLSLVGANAFRDVLGRPLGDLFDAETGGLDVLLAERGGHASCENRVRLPSGAEGILRFTKVGGGSDADTIVVIVEDVTALRAAEVRAEKSNKLQAVQALMGALMHHMNQPLTVVMIRAKLMHQALEKGSVDPEQIKSAMKDIMDLTMKMATLLRQVEQSRDFETQEYVKGLDILKIDPSESAP